MGVSASNPLNSSSSFQRNSKTNVNNDTTDRMSQSNENDQTSMNHSDISMSRNFMKEFIPERYFVLLTEQVAEMLFRLMNFSEIPMIVSECEFDHRSPIGMSVGSGHALSLMTSPNLNSTSIRPSVQLQQQYQSIKCRRKMLTIEEFRELNGY